MFKIIKKTAVVLNVHKTWIFACIGITASNDRTEYKQARFSSFTKGLQELCDWLAKYNCTDICMESTSKYLIPVFRFKLTCMIVGEKNRAQNCLTVSNLKLDDVFTMYLENLPVLSQNKYLITLEKF